jgi:hypothetical protein
MMPRLLLSALKGRWNVAQGKREAGAERAALGSYSHSLFPLPQHVSWVGGEGQGEGVGTVFALRTHRADPTARIWQVPQPLLRISQTAGDSGERRRLLGTLTISSAPSAHFNGRRFAHTSYRQRDGKRTALAFGSF